MSSVNRLFVCLRCTTNRLNVADTVLKKTKFNLWGSLLIDSQARSPRFTRVFSSSCSSLQSLVRGYRTAPTETTGFAQNIYDENETDTADEGDPVVAAKWSEASDVVDEVAGAFSRFRISEVLQSKLQAQGINFLFPVQTSTYDHIYEGHDVIVQARTGCGKTLSYAVPIIERLHHMPESFGKRSPLLLVLTPTRELARQVADVISSLTDSLSTVCVYGGAPIGPQEAKVRSGVDVVVGTPGRITDFLERRTLDLSQLKHVVLDEVDRMLDMGFADSVDEILRHRYRRNEPDNKPQTLLFSATVPRWVQKTARKYLRSDIMKLDLVGEGTVRTATTVEHLAVGCRLRDRTPVIVNTLQVYSGSHGRAIVFCETKREADLLATSNAMTADAHVLHGDIPQDKREMVLKGFREGRYQVLIATDVAARGLDIPEVDLVIQCSPPKDVDSYIHRSGRTGRAGRSGISVVLYQASEMAGLGTVERVAGIRFKKIAPPNAERLATSAAEDAIKSLDSVSRAAVERFIKMAEDVAASRGAIEALAAAIAVISGNDKPRSLLTATPGFTTYLYRPGEKLYKRFRAWQLLEQLISAEVKNQITGLQLCADYRGCVFDIPSELDSDIGSMTGFSRIAELPALEEVQFDDDRRRLPGRKSSYDDEGHFDDRRRQPGRTSYGGGWQRQTPPSRRHNSAYGQRFSDSSYWKNQSSRQRRDRLWESDDD